MPVEVSWFNTTHTAIVVRYVGVWTIAEFHQSYDEAMRQVAVQQHPVDIVIDFRESNHIPPGLLSVVRSAIHKRPANADRLIAVGMNTLMRGLVSMLTQMPMVDMPIYVVKDMEEAQMIMQVAPSQEK